MKNFDVRWFNLFKDIKFSTEKFKILVLNINSTTTGMSKIELRVKKARK